MARPSDSRLRSVPHDVLRRLGAQLNRLSEPEGDAVKDGGGERAEPPVRVFMAPGRVNLMGDHTDYNGGLVAPAAIGLATYLACRPHHDVLLVSEQEEGVCTASADGVCRGNSGDARMPDWGSYVCGVLEELARRGRPAQGFRGAVVSDVPVGRGLSSSAALEVAVAVAATTLASWKISPWEIAEACRSAEERRAGVECGIMDQAVGVLARAGAVCLIDTWKRSVTHVPWPPDLEIVVVDTGVRRSLASSPYKSRREECRRALDQLRKDNRFSRISHLSQLNQEQLDEARRLLEPELFRRVRHVVTENARVLAVVELLATLRAELETTTARPRANASRPTEEALLELAKIFEASHRSLVDDYEAGHPVTDRAVEVAKQLPGYVGARQTGAGWGGSVVALFRKPFGRRAADELVGELRGEAPLRATDSAQKHPPGSATCGSLSATSKRSDPAAWVTVPAGGATELIIA